MVFAKVTKERSVTVFDPLWWYPFMTGGEEICRAMLKTTYVRLEIGKNMASAQMVRNFVLLDIYLLHKNLPPLAI